MSISGIPPRYERVIDPSGGANQTRVRAHNERLVLSLVRRHGELPKSEIARRSGLSAQTVSVIMRALEADGLLLRGEPQRGRVGQPSIPMRLDADGVFSIGLKIGRRSADLVLTDFVGSVREHLYQSYSYPKPDKVVQFVERGIGTLKKSLSATAFISGLGIATPFELWNWAEKIGAPQREMARWRDFNLGAAIAEVTDLPIFVQNDATAACGAELVFGRGREFTDFIYFFIGWFIGGGVVLNHEVYTGRTGSAGAIGPMPIILPTGGTGQLLERASIFTLEQRLKEAGIDPSPLWLEPDQWDGFGDLLDEWIAETSRYLALAIVSACSIIDFEATLIDGGFPTEIRGRLVDTIRREVQKLDLQGIEAPQIVAGSLGAKARAIGGASQPLFARFLLDQNVLFKELA